MNTYKITFTDNETVEVQAYDSRIRDGILQLATSEPGRFSRYLPIVNMFGWTVTRG